MIMWTLSRAVYNVSLNSRGHVDEKKLQIQCKKVRNCIYLIYKLVQLQSLCFKYNTLELDRQTEKIVFKKISRHLFWLCLKKNA